MAGRNRREFIEAMGRATVEAIRLGAEELKVEVERVMQAYRGVGATPHPRNS